MPNKNPTVQEIVKGYLGKNGYDGLFNDEYSTDEGICSCPANDLMPCGGDPSQCMAGRIITNGIEEFIYYEKDKVGIGPEKE